MALDSKKVTGSIAIDLSKAFDSMCQKFLAELRAYGVGEEAIDFLHLNLSGRKQKVKLTEVSQIGYQRTVQCVRQPPGAPSD